MITLTDGDLMFVNALRELLGDEPPAPDPDNYTGHLLNLVARNYDEWERQVNAYRLLLGIRLVNTALEEA